MLTHRVPGRVLRALACCECSHVFSFAALQAQITEVPVRMEKRGRNWLGFTGIAIGHTNILILKVSKLIDQMYLLNTPYSLL